MTEDAYYVPSGPSQTELVEKRSRFLGQVFPVNCEEEAREAIARAKKQYHDARHNCWCYRLKSGGIERWSDDGEPQGTAGQPMLNVFQKEGVFDLCCVVTRYFGGVLLGAGGLARAYGRSAKDALDVAGKSIIRRWTRISVPCSYALLERAKLELERCGGLTEDLNYAVGVTIHALLPPQAVMDFQAYMTQMTAGTCTVQVEGEVLRAGKNKK